jgi:hypothetical protein
MGDFAECRNGLSGTCSRTRRSGLGLLEMGRRLVDQPMRCAVRVKKAYPQGGKDSGPRCVGRHGVADAAPHAVAVVRRGAGPAYGLGFSGWTVARLPREPVLRSASRTASRPGASPPGDCGVTRCTRCFKPNRLGVQHLDAGRACQGRITKSSPARRPGSSFLWPLFPRWWVIASQATILESKTAGSLGKCSITMAYASRSLSA